jgi:hypothetical protein
MSGEDFTNLLIFGSSESLRQENPTGGRIFHFIGTIMKDIAYLWDTKLMFENHLKEHGFESQLIHPGSIGSPFLPRFKLMIIPTGFANPGYSKLLPSLMLNKHRIEGFVNNGGTALVYGPMTEYHSYDWLPVNIEYIQRYGSVKIQKQGQSEASMIVDKSLVQCDGFFNSTEGECVLLNESDETILVKINYGDGLIIATTIHEYPASGFIRWAIDGSKTVSL